MELPRIKTVEAATNRPVLKVEWADGTRSAIDLTGLIHSSRHFQVFAQDRGAFKAVRVANWGSGVEWANGLDFSANSLKTMAGEQRTMTGADLRKFQTEKNLNTKEVAQLFGVADRTIRKYRSDPREPLSATVSMVLSRFQTEPLVFAAHYRPIAVKPRGRPRKRAVARH